ncbi:hypothetical protein ACLIX5_004456 [Salmonella enterica subsp. enterica serovar Bredeney]
MKKQELAALAAKNRRRLARDTEEEKQEIYEHDKPCRFCGTFDRYVGTNACCNCVELKLEAGIPATKTILQVGKETNE